MEEEGREGGEGRGVINTIERVSKCDCTCIPCIQIEVYPGQGCRLIACLRQVLQLAVMSIEMKMMQMEPSGFDYQHQLVEKR